MRNGNGAVWIFGRLTQPGRQRTAGPGLERAEAGIRRDPVQPGPYRRSAFEGVVRPPRPQQRLLDLVLGVVDGAQHSVTVRQQLVPVWPDELGELVAHRGAAPCCHVPSSVRPTDL